MSKLDKTTYLHKTTYLSQAQTTFQQSATTTFEKIRIKPICLRIRQTETLAEREERETRCGAESAKEGKLIIPGKRQVSKSETTCMSHYYW